MSPTPAQAMLLSRAEAKRLYAVSSLSTTSFFQTAIGGGEQGLAGGFGGAVLARLRSPNLAVATLLANTNNASAPTSGWLHVGGIGTSHGNRNWVVAQADTSPVYGAPIGVQALDVGRLVVLGLQFTGTLLRTLFDREVTVPGVAVSGYTPPTGRMTLGNDVTGAAPALAWDVLDDITWGGTPSDAQLLALFDYVRTNLRFPTSLTGFTFRHRHNVTDSVYLGSALPSGALAPTIVDAVTGLTADAFVPVGAPTVVVIDTKGDGRVSYGLTGFGVLAHYATTVAGALAGAATGFHVGGVIVPGGNLLSGTQMIAHCLQSDAARGWYLHVNNGVLRFVCINTGGGGSVAATYTISTHEMHRPFWWAVSLSASGAMRLLVNGVQVGSDVALSGTYGPSTTTPLRIGIYHSGSVQPGDFAFYGLFGGGDATVAELAQAYADYVSTGTVQGVSGKSTRLYRPTTDIAAAGGRGTSPLTIADRIGGNALSRVGGLTVDTSFGNGLRGFDGTNYFYISRSSPLAAVTTTFHGEAIVYVRSGTTYAKVFGTNETASAGWTFGVHENVFYVNMGSASGPRGVSCAMTMNAWHHLAFTLDASGYLRLYVDGTQQAGSPGMAFTADPTGEFKIYGVEPTTLAGVAVGTSVPTDPEIAASASAALSAKKLSGISGKTTRLWSPPDDVIGTSAPAGLRDRSTNANDNLTFSAPSPPVTQRTEKLWTYDTAPVLYGVRSLSDANHFTNASAIMPGNAGGFWVTLAFSLEVLSTVNILASGGSWDIRQGSNYVYFNVFDGGSAFRASPIVGPTARELNKLIVVTGVLDAAALRVRLYHRRTEVGTGAVTAAGLVGAGAFYLGRAAGAGAGAAGTTIYGLAYGHGIPSAGLIAAQHDGILATDGRMQAIPGLTAHLYDFHADALLGGGTIGASALDRVGVSHLARVGSPSTYARYSRMSTI